MGKPRVHRGPGEKRESWSYVSHTDRGITCGMTKDAFQDDTCLFDLINQKNGETWVTACWSWWKHCMFLNFTKKSHDIPKKNLNTLANNKQKHKCMDSHKS